MSMTAPTLHAQGSSSSLALLYSFSCPRLFSALSLLLLIGKEHFKKKTLCIFFCKVMYSAASLNH